MIIGVLVIEEGPITALKKTVDQLLVPGERRLKRLDRHSLKNMNDVEKRSVIVFQTGWDRQGQDHPGAHALRDLENKGEKCWNHMV